VLDAPRLAATESNRDLTASQVREVLAEFYPMEWKPANVALPAQWFFHPLAGGRVIEVNLYSMYEVGSRARKVLQLNASDKRRDVNRILLDAYGWISSFQLEARHVQLERTMNATGSLVKLITVSIDMATAENFNEPVGDQFIQTLQKYFQRFEEAFRVEASRANVYAITSKGLYDTRKLMEVADEKFSEKVRKMLPEQTVYDLREAGKCLAVECPTAAVFHMLRGTEAFMLKYYEALAGKPWPFVKNKDWGSYITHLKKRNAPTNLTNRLDEIRAFERNPIIHPEHNVAPARALPMFDLVSAVIILMAEEMESLAATP
jgi:hypothetical protein